jgi:ATP/maltotriose-dependent transcriptional regulator MalT
VTAISLPQCHLLEPLTLAEENVLRLMTQGLSDKEIGLKLSIAPITVRGDHKQNLYDKLGLQPGFRNRKWAVHCARQLGLVPGGDGEQDLVPQTLSSWIRRPARKLAT